MNYPTKGKRRSRRSQLILSRWWDLLQLGLVGAGVLLVGWAYLPPQISTLARVFPSGMLGWVLVLAALIVLFVQPWGRWATKESWWSFQQNVWRSVLRVRCYHAYPPTWVGGIIGVFVLTLVLGFKPELLIALDRPASDGEAYKLAAVGSLGLLTALVGQAMAWSPYSPRYAANRFSIVLRHLNRAIRGNRAIVRLVSFSSSALALAAALMIDRAQVDPTIWALVIGSIAGTTFPVWAEPLRPKLNLRAEASTPALKNIAFRSFKELRAWLAIDQPVVDAEEDTLNHTPIARRIARRLRSKDFPAMIVLGPLGSGKTTLGHLVQEELKATDERTQLVHMEMWQYKSSDAAAAGLLDALIEALAQWSDVLRIRGLSDRYLDAMSAAGGLWGGFSKLQSPTGVDKSLQGFDDIALVTNHRFVLWIDDLERFSGNTGPAADRWKHWNKIQPLLALLFRLERMESVTVVIATTKESLSFDQEKIARFIEKLPEFSWETKARLINQFRNGCHHLFPSLIDPSPKLREELNQLEKTDQLRYTKALLGFQSAGISVAILSFCNTPRILKTALRRCLDFWGRFPGEINFDQLLVANLVRADSEFIFEALSETRPLFLSAGNKWHSSGQANDKSPETILTKHLEAASVPAEKISASLTVAKFLFAPNSKSVGQTFSSSTLRNQVYWDIFLNEIDLDEEEKDQPLLQQLMSGPDDKVIDLVCIHSLNEALRDFRGVIGPDRTKKIFPMLIERLSHQIPAKDWNPRNDLEGNFRCDAIANLVGFVVDLSKDGALSSDDLWPILRDAIPKAVANNLSLAAELDYYFVVAAATTHDVLRTGSGGTRRQEARRLLHQCLQDVYTGQPNLLAEALEGQSPPALMWLLWGLERVRTKDAEFSAGKPVFSGELPFTSGWQEFADTILQAIPIKPKACLIQIAWLLVHTSSGFDGTHYKFDEELAIRLFGSLETLRANFIGEKREEWEDFPIVQELLFPKPLSETKS